METHDYLICSACTVYYLNDDDSHIDYEPRELGQIVIDIDTEEFHGMATNWGGFMECEGCSNTHIDFYPAYKLN